MPVVRLGSTVENTERSDEVVQFVGDPVIRGAGTEQIRHDDPFAELERLIAPVVPRQPPEALQHPAFEHVTARAVELCERGFDVGCGQFGHVAVGQLPVPLLSSLHP